jgi:hypothetical protein
MKKKRDKTVFPSPDTYSKKYRGWILPGAFVPISADDASRRSYVPFTPQTPSLWQRFTAWLHYSSIQIRWDIERWLARKLHRRWS